MKTRSLILLASAVTLAAGAALVGRSLMRPPPPVTIVKEVPAQAAPKPPVRYVLSAGDAMAAGLFVKSDTLKTLNWRETTDDAVRADDFAAANDQERRKIEREIYGAALRQPLTAGQTLTQGALVYPGEPGFLAAVLTPGMRAVSIPTSAVDSNSGLVNSGDRVDVILALQRDGVEKPSPMPNSEYAMLASQTIVRNVRVLAMNNNAVSLTPPADPEAAAAAEKTSGKRAAADNAKRNNRSLPAPNTLFYESLTLEVSPADAERLALAREVGTLQVALLSMHEAQTSVAASREATRLNAATAVFDGTTPRMVNTYQGTAAAVQTYRGNRN
ncbi:Flp pilus assembly protein CpaB [Bordetella ansorpii]|uniref:Flp pilus assembly protein CpaB n=1 Tax=Bordetella ansorpii TaxID=288768 RepID=A0A157R8L9_9BORD|nr:Flp pilus assembly protein CpaB [Bordetella ansorpii]